MTELTAKEAGVRGATIKICNNQKHQNTMIRNPAARAIQQNPKNVWKPKIAEEVVAEKPKKNNNKKAKEVVETPIVVEAPIIVEAPIVVDETIVEAPIVENQTEEITTTTP